MLARREVTKENLSSLLRLEVRDDQKHLVASTAVTLAQAAYEPGSYVWGLWQGETAVGLVAMLHPHEAQMVEGEDPDAAYLWRLLMDKRFQNKGLGRQAIALCLQQTRDWGLPRLASSVVDSPDSNLGFYEHIGFCATGTIVEEEIVISMDVTST